MELGVTGSRMELGSRFDLGYSDRKIGSRMEMGLNNSLDPKASPGSKRLKPSDLLGSRYDIGEMYENRSRRSNLRHGNSKDGNAIKTGTTTDLGDAFTAKLKRKKEQEEEELRLKEEEEAKKAKIAISNVAKMFNRKKTFFQRKLEEEKQSTQSFFMAKGKGKFEDIEKERAYRLKK